MEWCMSQPRPSLAICLYKEAVIKEKIRKYRVHSSLLSMEPIASNNCNALRVSPAVTRLTVYRELEVLSDKNAFSDMLKKLSIL